MHDNPLSVDITAEKPNCHWRSIRSINMQSYRSKYYAGPTFDRRNGLVSTRYLMLMGHLILAVSCFMARDENVKASLPMDFSHDDYYYKDMELITALSLSVSCIFIELLTFGTGLTMFNGLTSAYSIVAHGSGTLLHAYFILDIWDCWLYWWIFTLTGAMPLCFDLGTILSDICRRNLKYQADKRLVDKE